LVTDVSGEATPPTGRPWPLLGEEHHDIWMAELAFYCKKIDTMQIRWGVCLFVAGVIMKFVKLA
jgi:hypothetical protein